MTPYVQMLMQHIRPEAQAAFGYEYQRHAKDATLAMLLTILLGIIGGESYYLGNYKRGILMTLALFSGIGLFVSVPMWIARCFTVSGECDSYNDYLAYTLAFRYLPFDLAMDAPQPPQPAPSATPSRSPIGGLPMRSGA